MANMHLHHDKCSKKLKTFQALVKHSKKCYVDRPILRRSVFFQDDKEVPLIAPQGIRSPTVRSEYTIWLIGVVECLNGIHNYRHNIKFTLVTNG